MSVPHVGELAAVATALCWTVSALTFGAAVRRASSLAINLLRLVIAMGPLVVYGAIARGRPLPTDAPAHTWLWLSLSGLVGFFLCDLCLLRCYAIVGPRIGALLLTALAPPISALLAWGTLGEMLTPLQWTGMAVTLAGVVWVVRERRQDAAGQSRGHSPVGVLLGVLAAVGQATALVLAKQGMRLGIDPATGAPRDYDPASATQIRAIAAMVAFALLLAALRWYPRVVAAMRDWRTMAFTTAGSVAGPCLGVTLWLLSIQYILLGVAQTIVATVPVLIIPFVVLLYRERVSLRAILGACAAVAGVAMLLWPHG